MLWHDRASPEKVLKDHTAWLRRSRANILWWLRKHHNPDVCSAPLVHLHHTHVCVYRWSFNVPGNVHAVNIIMFARLIFDHKGRVGKQHITTMMTTTTTQCVDTCWGDSRWATNIYSYHTCIFWAFHQYSTILLECPTNHGRTLSCNNKKETNRISANKNKVIKIGAGRHAASNTPKPKYIYIYRDLDRFNSNHPHPTFLPLSCGRCTKHTAESQEYRPERTKWICFSFNLFHRQSSVQVAYDGGQGVVRCGSPLCNRVSYQRMVKLLLIGRFGCNV